MMCHVQISADEFSKSIVEENFKVMSQIYFVIGTMIHHHQITIWCWNHIKNITFQLSINRNNTIWLHIFIYIFQQHVWRWVHRQFSKLFRYYSDTLLYIVNHIFFEIYKCALTVISRQLNDSTLNISRTNLCSRKLQFSPLNLQISASAVN